MDPEAERGSDGCEGNSSIQKTKIGDKIITSNGKRTGLDSCGRFGQKKCRTDKQADTAQIFNSPRCELCDYAPDNRRIDPNNAPDYMTFTLSAGEVVGGTFILTRDRYDNVYIGFGGNVGKSLTPVSGSLTKGWIGDPFDNYYPSEEDTQSFLTGFSVNVSAGFLGGGGVTFSPNSNISPLGYETGIYSPQVGASAVFSGLLLDN